MEVPQGLSVGADQGCLLVRQLLFKAERPDDALDLGQIGPGIIGKRWCSIW